jgi:predicted RNA binding protein YcfA (HicA-like mRNA interferase family)
MGGGRLATRDKRLEAIRRNPKNVRFAELRAVLEDHGFCGRQGRGDHWVFVHEQSGKRVTVDPRRPFVLLPYVKNALKALAELEEGSTE